jgi:hypothetical protein
MPGYKPALIARRFPSFLGVIGHAGEGSIRRDSYRNREQANSNGRNHGVGCSVDGRNRESAAFETVKVSRFVTYASVPFGVMARSCTSIG